MIVVFISSHADLFSCNFCEFGLSACLHFKQTSGVVLLVERLSYTFIELRFFICQLLVFSAFHRCNTTLTISDAEAVPTKTELPATAV
jgi:hypothetical protein